MRDWPHMLSLLAMSLAMAALAPGAAHAGAWPQDEGRWLLVNQFTYSNTATNGYGSQGQPSGHGRLQQFEFSPYIEYGVTRDWTLGIQPRLQLANLTATAASGGGGNSEGLAEVNLFARYTIYRWDFDVLAVQATLGTAGTADPNYPLIADPWPEYEARVLYGHGFQFSDTMSAFFDSELAYRLEGGHNADQVHFDNTIGFKPDPDWIALLQLDSTFGLGNKTGNGSNYNQYRLLAEFGTRLFGETWLVVGGYHDLGGHDVALGNGVTLAVWTKF